MMNVSRVAAGAWLAAASLLLLAPSADLVDAATATCAHPGAHHTFHSYEYTPSTANAPLSPTTHPSLAAAESRLAATEALFTFAAWSQLRKVEVDVYEPKKGHEAGVYLSESANVQVCDVREGIATLEADKYDQSVWLQPQEDVLGLADAGLRSGADLNGLLACADEKQQVDTQDSTETGVQSELLLLEQSEDVLFTSEQLGADMVEIDKVLAVLEADFAMNMPAQSLSTSQEFARDTVGALANGVNPNNPFDIQQSPAEDSVQLVRLSVTDLPPASTEHVTISGEVLPSASSSDWIDSLEVKNLSTLFSALNQSSEPAPPVQLHQPVELLEIPARKIDARVFVPTFSVRIEGRTATPAHQKPQLARSSWAMSVKAAPSEFLVGPPTLLAVRPHIPVSRDERVERWKLKRKTRPTTPAPRRKPEPALSNIRRAVAAKRQRVGGRFVSSGKPVVASFVPITALQM